MLGIVYGGCRRRVVTEPRGRSQVAVKPLGKVPFHKRRHHLRYRGQLVQRELEV